jgi:hypothetical protein
MRLVFTDKHEASRGKWHYLVTYQPESASRDDQCELYLGVIMQQAIKRDKTVLFNKEGRISGFGNLKKLCSHGYKLP